MLNVEAGLGSSESGVARVFRPRFSGLPANRPSILHISTMLRRKTNRPTMQAARTRRNAR